MNKRMIIFAKIVSILVILNFIILQISNAGKSTFILTSIINLILLTLLQYPLFYYAFYKIKSKKIKLWAKIITFVAPVIIFLTFYFLGNFEDTINLIRTLSGVILEILALIAIYYYAWIEKN